MVLILALKRFLNTPPLHEVLEVDDDADEPFANDHQNGVDNALPNNRSAEHVCDWDREPNRCLVEKLSAFPALDESKR